MNVRLICIEFGYSLDNQQYVMQPILVTSIQAVLPKNESLPETIHIRMFPLFWIKK